MPESNFYLGRLVDPKTAKPTTTRVEYDPADYRSLLAPMLELSFRQSLAMSAGSYGIFVDRPITAVMLALAVTMLLLGMRSIFRRTPRT